MWKKLARPEKEPKTELAVRLRKVRQVLGDPERGAMVDALGVSVGAIARYERGEAEPTASVLAGYRVHYEIDLDWLITGKGTMHVGDDVKVGDTNMAHVRKVVQNIAYFVAGQGLRRMKPEAYAAHFLELFDYLMTLDDYDEKSAEKVIEFGSERLKRASGQGD